jgi:hypothetical protein
VAVVVGVAALRDPGNPGAGTAPTAVADFSFAVQFAGRVYVGEALVPPPTEPVARVGEAEVRSCNDTGPLPGGVAVPEAPRQVTASASPGCATEQVSTVPDPEGVLALVSADLPREQRLALVAALQQVGAATG